MSSPKFYILNLGSYVPSLGHEFAEEYYFEVLSDLTKLVDLRYCAQDGILYR